MADLAQARDYFTALFQDGDEFELVAVRDGRARRATFGLADLNSVLAACEAFEEQNFNVYASVLPLAQQEAGTYDRIWIDRDDPKAPWPFGADPNWTLPAWPSPTVCVRTSQVPGEGERWQGIWILKESMDEATARGAIKALAAAGVGDASVHDPRRVLRVPGVRNAKRDSMTKLLSTTTARADWDSFLIEVTPPGEPPTMTDLLSGSVSAPHAILGEWLGGVGEGDRARKAYVAARFLKSCGVSFDDALSLIRVGASRCEPVLDGDEGMPAVRSAFHRAD